VRPFFVSSNSRRAWLWPLLVAALIFTASSRSRVAGPPVVYFDKYAHFFVYGLLGTLLVRALQGRRGAAWAALALASLYGVSDEFHQHFVPGRSCEVGDWIADTSGAALAILLYATWARYRGLLESRVGGNRRVENPAAAARVVAP
jgi:VanZ family protein